MEIFGPGLLRIAGDKTSGSANILMDTIKLMEALVSRNERSAHVINDRKNNITFVEST